MAALRVTVTLCALVWAREGAEAALVDYEDRVLALLPRYGARVVQRLRTNGAPDEPFEVHALEFPSEAVIDAFMGDERRVALDAERERAVARVSVMRVEPVSWVS
jgi:hypothetical protein